MNLKITRLTPDAPLPLLQEVPSYGVCRIEGFNGVGKSLTVRLLRLCSGEHPYLGQQALWDGFRAGIGRVRVSATELADDSQIVWELDAQALPENATNGAAAPTDDWFEVLTINGEPSTLAEVARRFEVRLIRANEGLLETLADDLDTAALEVRGYERELATSGALVRLEQSAGSLLRLLEQTDPARLRDRQAEASRSRVAYAASLEAWKAAEAHLKRIAEAIELSEATQRLSRERPALQAELGAVEERLLEVRENRRKAQLELESLETDLAKSQEAKETLRTANISYKRETTRFGKARDRLTAALQTAGLDAPENAPTLADSLRESLEKLRTTRLEIDASPAVLQHGATVRAALQSADADGVGAQTVAELSGRNYSFRQIDDGIRRRAEHLAERPATPSASELDVKIDEIAGRLNAVESVPALAEAMSDAGRRLKTAEANLSDLTATAEGADLERLERLREQRRAIDEELYALASRRIVLTHQLDELGARQEHEQVRTQLQQLLQQLDADEAQLPAIRSDANVRVRELAAVNERDSASAREADAAATRAEEELEQVAQVLASSPELDWLRGARPDLVPRPESDVANKLDLIDRLTAVVKAADDRVSRFRLSLTSARVALEAEADVLRGGEPNAREYRKSARAWAQQRAEEWFSEAAVRKVLIGDVGSVTVDLGRRTVSWSDRAGVEHGIPLQAFSSGQSVFAYTEAQLLRLGRAKSTATNRLIVIDEFGAFVARNRLQDLRRTLLSWHTSHPDDQIVLILPVNQDYETLLETAVGHRADELRHTVSALKSDGYFAESFEA
jgi:chromosome segregation ATPase